jgi:hypothetical protein
MNKHIDDSLDMVPLDDVYEPAPIEKREPTQQENDYEYARENFYNVIEKGTQALEDMLDVAKASEHPRAYEVVSTLMKTLVDANKDLVEMGKKKAQEEAPKDAPVTNNNLFVGSTAELQQLLKDMRNDD